MENKMVGIDMDKKRWLLVHKILGMGWLDMIWQMREALDPGSWTLLVESILERIFFWGDTFAMRLHQSLTERLHFEAL